MRRTSCWPIAAVAFSLLWAIPVRADEIAIRITSGFSAPESPAQGNGSFELFGTGGFSFIGGFDFSHISPPCCLHPGEIGTIGQSAETDDVGGTVTFAGQTYTNVGFDNSVNQAALSFVSHSFIAPPAGTPTATILEPFTFTGWFHGRPGDGNDSTGGSATLRATLTGAGVARVSLTWVDEIVDGQRGIWVPGTPRFDFTSPASTPEPASLVLLGLGVASAWSVRRRTEKHS